MQGFKSTQKQRVGFSWTRLAALSRRTPPAPALWASSCGPCQPPSQLLPNYRYPPTSLVAGKHTFEHLLIRVDLNPEADPWAHQSPISELAIRRLWPGRPGRLSASSSIAIDGAGDESCSGSTRRPRNSQRQWVESALYHSHTIDRRRSLHNRRGVARARVIEHLCSTLLQD